MKRAIEALAFPALLLSANVHADTFVRDDIITAPTPERFSVCHDYGCKSLATLALTQTQWSTLRAHFFPAPRDAAEERARIAAAVAAFETLVGPLTGTAGDRGGNFKGLGNGGQMDCIDESTNTTTYLRLLAADGLLRHHTVEDRATRGFFLFGWPHSTAVIAERGGGSRYVVDSWFRDNGAPPDILPLEQWSDGWSPES